MVVSILSLHNIREESHEGHLLVIGPERGMRQHLRINDWAPRWFVAQHERHQVVGCSVGLIMKGIAGLTRAQHISIAFQCMSIRMSSARDKEVEHTAQCEDILSLSQRALLLR